MEQAIGAMYVGVAIILLCAWMGIWHSSEREEAQMQRWLAYQYSNERLLIDRQASTQMWGQ